MTSSYQAILAAKLPTTITDLALLVKTCHKHGIRFFTDVMAFATQYAYREANLYALF